MNSLNSSNKQISEVASVNIKKNKKNLVMKRSLTYKETFQDYLCFIFY